MLLPLPLLRRQRLRAEQAAAATRILLFPQRTSWSSCGPQETSRACLGARPLARSSRRADRRRRSRFPPGRRARGGGARSSCCRRRTSERRRELHRFPPLLPSPRFLLLLSPSSTSTTGWCLPELLSLTGTLWCSTEGFWRTSEEKKFGEVRLFETRVFFPSIFFDFCIFYCIIAFLLFFFQIQF